MTKKIFEFEPRGLKVAQAAAYVGISYSTYMKYAHAGDLPLPMPVANRIDKAALDRALDKLSGISDGRHETEFDVWKRASAV
ncbi:MAG: hypothetical protein ACPG1C_04800 [Alphaproteobacteria bacterium]